MVKYVIYLDVFCKDKNFRPSVAPLGVIDCGLFGRNLRKHLETICKWPTYGYDIYASKDGKNFIAYWRDLSIKGTK